jgi:DedD protein
MDLALKQRLIGAAVLIALAVIFVPMFLGRAPQQENTTLHLDIPPPPDRKFETRTLPVTEPATPVAPDKLVTVDTHAPGNLERQPDTQAAPPSTVAAPAKAAAPDKATTANPVAAAPSTTTAGGRFAVQLGVYADPAHADALVMKLKKLGYTASRETIEYQGKPAQRVRVGPFADRAAAEAARLAIKQNEPKVSGSVIESAEAQPSAAPTALPANRAGGFAVQLGAFKAEAEANKLRDRLRSAGFPSFVDRTGGGDGILWRVRAGPFAERSGADQARDAIEGKLKLKGLVVTQP